jgi:hypothetical protein
MDDIAGEMGMSRSAVYQSAKLELAAGPYADSPHATELLDEQRG